MAELNEPACCNVSSLSDRFTTVSSDEDVEDSGEDASESSSGASAEPESVLSWLKAPDRSCLCRKRSIAVNQSRKQPKKSSVRGATDPSSVTPFQRAKEFSSEYISVSAGKLFCRACREELSLKKSSTQKHVTSSKHTAGKEKLVKKEKRDMDIVEALQKYDTNAHPSGETLPEAVRVYRVKVLRTFIKAGIPINKIDDFRDLLEDYAFHLAGRKSMSDLIPFILSEEKKQLKAEIDGVPVAVIFNGTSRLGEALAVILRFVDRSTLKIHQRLVCIQLLAKSLTGEEVARELLSVLSTEYGVVSSNLLAAMHDRASVNSVAVRTLKVLYPNVLNIGCFSHTIDHVGDNFDTPVLYDFGTTWVSLFSHSPKAHLLWRSRTGIAMRSYSKTRWWSRW